MSSHKLATGHLLLCGELPDQNRPFLIVLVYFILFCSDSCVLSHGFKRQRCTGRLRPAMKPCAAASVCSSACFWFYHQIDGLLAGMMSVIEDGPWTGALLKGRHSPLFARGGDNHLADGLVAAAVSVTSGGPTESHHGLSIACLGSFRVSGLLFLSRASDTGNRARRWYCSLGPLVLNACCLACFHYSSNRLPLRLQSAVFPYLCRVLYADGR